MRVTRKPLRTSRLLSAAAVATLVVHRSELLRADTSDSAEPTALIVPALVSTKTWDGTTNDYHSPHWSGTTTGVGDQLSLSSGTVSASLASGQYISLSATSTDGLSLAMSAGNLILTDASGSGDSGLSVDKSTISFSGGAIIASQEKIGLAGSASFVQSGGVNSIGTLTLVTSAGSVGTYALSSGILTANTEQIGAAPGTATFAHSGGSNSTGNVMLATASGAVANYTLSNGTLNSSNIYIGGNGSVAGGAATLTTSAGTVNNSGQMVVYSGGKLLMTGGTVITQSLDISQAGSLSLTRGKLDINGGTFLLGASGLTLGSGADSPQLILNNATVSGGTLTIAGGAVSLLGSGTISSPALILNGNATLSIASPGASSTLHTANVQFLNASNFALNINSSVGSNDELISAGSVSVSSANFRGADLAPSYLPNGTQIVLLSAAGGVTGSFNGLPEGGSLSIASNVYTISYQSAGNTQVTLTSLGNKIWDGSTNDFRSAHWSGLSPDVGDMLTLNSGTVTASLGDTQYITMGPTSSDGQQMVINGGSVVMTDAGGTGNSGLRVNSGGTVTLGSTGVLKAATLDLSGGGRFIQNNGNLQVATKLILGNGSQFTQNGGVAALGDVIQTNGTSTFTVQRTLSTNNIYVGGDSNGPLGTGTLLINSLGSVVNAGTVKVHSTGTLIVNGGYLATSVLDVSSAGSFALSSGSILVNNGTVLGPSAGLTVGDGKGFASFYISNTSVSAATINLQAKALLSGNGTVSGAINVVSASIGASAGSGELPLNASSIKFAAGSTMSLYLSDPGSSPGFQTTGSISLGSGITSLAPVAAFDTMAAGNVYTILSAAGGVNGTFANLPEGGSIDVNDSRFTIDYNANGGRNVTLTAVNIPGRTNAGDVTLLVNPTNGRVTLVNAVQSGQAVITAYTINSPSGSVLAFSQDGNFKYLGNSLENNPAVFYKASNGKTYNRWTGIKNTSSFIGEAFDNHRDPNHDSTWTNYTLGTSGYALGTLFRRLSSGGTRDLVFQWEDAGLNVYTSVVNYVVAPEPGSVSLMAIGAMGMLVRRRRLRSAR